MMDVAQLLRENLPAFSTAIRGYTNSQHHIEWYRLMSDDSIKRLLLLGPRGHSKTECVLNYICWAIGRNPNLRIMLVSNAFTQSSNMLRKVSVTIQNNLLYQAVFPNVTPDLNTWNDEQIIVKREIDHKDPTVVALGVLAKIPSRRADLIINDDLIGEDEVRYPSKAEAVKVFYEKVLSPCLEPQGRIINIGTRWGHNDLYADLAEKKGYVVKTYKAVQEDGSPLWLEKFPLDVLMRIKDEMGSIHFNTQYMNDPLPEGVSPFKREWLENKWSSLPLELTYFIGVDPAISEARDADQTAVVTVGVDKNMNMYVVDVVRRKILPPDVIRLIIDKYEQFHPFKIGIEAIAFQRAISQALMSMGNFPVVEVKSHQKDKVTRLSSLSPFFENGKLRLGKNQEELEDEILRFPRGKHDDMVDALEMAVSLVGRGNLIKPWASRINMFKGVYG